MLKSLDNDELKNHAQILRLRFIIRICLILMQMTIFWIETVTNIFAKYIYVKI